MSLAPLLARWSYTTVSNAILEVTLRRLCDILWVLPKLKGMNIKGQGLLSSTLKSLCQDELEVLKITL